MPVMFPKDKVIEQLLMFFTKEQVDKLVAKANDESYIFYSKTLRLTTDGIGEYQSQIVSAIDEKKALNLLIPSILITLRHSMYMVNQNLVICLVSVVWVWICIMRKMSVLLQRK